MKAPYYYDLDNTGYYTNPASTSNMNAAVFAGVIDANGGHGGINITNTSILSSATSNWTGNPGGAGKIQYHSNRWYIVSDSSSDRIVQFRRDSLDLSYVDNSGRFRGDLTSTGDVRAPIYYDVNNTAYYTRPSSSSFINSLHTAGSIQIGTGVAGDLYIGSTSGANLRIFTVSGTSYVDMNNGDLYWRQGSSIRYWFYASTGNWKIGGTLNQLSDIRIKENIIEIDDCINKVKSIRGVYYNRTDYNTEVKSIGVIAQEVEIEMPELVQDDKDTGIKSVSYSNISAVLVNAIKEQQVIIEDLKSRLETLENK